MKPAYPRPQRNCWNHCCHRPNRTRSLRLRTGPMLPHDLPLLPLLPEGVVMPPGKVCALGFPRPVPVFRQSVGDSPGKRGPRGYDAGKTE